MNQIVRTKDTHEIGVLGSYLGDDTYAIKFKNGQSRVLTGSEIETIPNYQNKKSDLEHMLPKVLAPEKYDLNMLN